MLEWRSTPVGITLIVHSIETLRLRGFHWQVKCTVRVILLPTMQSNVGARVHQLQTLFLDAQSALFDSANPIVARLEGTTSYP